MTATLELVTGRIQFKTAAKNANVTIRTKLNREFRSWEVSAVRDASFEELPHWVETRDSVKPAWFRISDLTDVQKIRLIQAGFITRYAIENTYGGSEALVEYWAKPAN